MNTEFEKDSAPKLENLLEGVDAVGFDIDNTLLRTDVYYDSAVELVGIELAESLSSNETAESVSKRFSESVTAIFRESNYKPSILQELCASAYERCFDREVTYEVKERIENVLYDFYMNSPLPYDSTKEVLERVQASGKRIFLHSHGQEDVTKVKVDILSDLIGTDIPFKATDITLKKDAQSWLESAEIVSTPIDKILVIGDNFYADILPAINAGCKKLIWIKRREVELPEDFFCPPGVEIFVVKDLAELL